MTPIINLPLPSASNDQTMLKYPFQPFPASIKIDYDPVEATRFARAEYTPDPNLPNRPEGQRMVFWCNSKTNSANHSGIGVTYKRSSDRWVNLEFRIQREVKDWVAEIAAVSKALQIAAEEVSEAERKPETVVVYSGSKGALERLRKGIWGVIPGQKFLLRPGILAAEKIKNCGVAVELRWGPDTEGVEGSRRARHAARRGSNYVPTSRLGDTVLEVQPNAGTKRARARARAKPRPPVAIFPDVEKVRLEFARLGLEAN